MLSRLLDSSDLLGLPNTNLRPRPTRPGAPYFDLRFFHFEGPDSMTGRSRGALMPPDWIALQAQVSFSPRRPSVSVCVKYSSLALLCFGRDEIGLELGQDYRIRSAIGVHSQKSMCGGNLSMTSMKNGSIRGPQLAASYSVSAKSR
jgi:hypothetical protein